MPAAYDLLVLKRPVTQGETNRFDRIALRENGRDVLLDMEVVNSQTSAGGELENWLTQVEARSKRIEPRTAR